MFFCLSFLCFFFLMIRRPPRSTRMTHSFPTRRSSDLGRGRLRRRGGDRHVGVGVSISPVRHRDRIQKLVVGVDPLLLPRRSRLLCLSPQRPPRALVLGEPCHPSFEPAL